MATEGEKDTRNPDWIKRVRTYVTLTSVYIFARFDRRGVRYQARQRLRTILGKRYREFHRSTESNIVIKALSATWTWGLIVPVLIAVIICISNIIPRDFEISNNLLTESLTIFLPVPLALVGLVIPFLALAVGVVYSRMGAGAVFFAMRQNLVIRLVYSSLAILGFLILTQLFLKMSGTILGPDTANEFVSRTGWLFVLMSTWWVIYSLVLAGVSVISVLAVFEPAKALRAIKKEIVLESMRTLDHEFEENLSLTVLEDKLKDSYLEVGFFQPGHGELINSKKIGNIVNISYWGLSRINAIIAPMPNSFLKIILSKPHYYISEHDSQLAVIRGDVSRVVPLALLKRSIRSCFNVRKQREKKDRLYQALEHYKEITNSFLKGDNEDLVRVALDGYGQVLCQYVSIGLKLSSEDYPRFFGDWRPIMLIMDALKRCVATVVSTSDAKNVGMVAHWIKVMMEKCIRKQEEYLFSRLLNLYRSMYYYACKSQNVSGIQLSHFQPMQLLDFDIFRFGKTESVPHEKVAYRCKLAKLIVQHLARLLRDSLDANEPGAVEEMLSHLQPKELYGYFRPDLPFDCFEVERQLSLEKIERAERLTLEDQQKSCQILESFRKESHQWHIDILHNSLMYLIDKIAHEAVKITAIETVINIIWAKFPDWLSTVDWLERYNVGRQIFDERLWEYWPESRRGQSKNPLAAPICLFTIRGLSLQSGSSIPIDIPGTRTIDGLYNQIMEVARIIQGTNDWRELAGNISEETLQLFEKALANSRQKYKDDVAESVKRALLSDKKISEFRQKIIKAYYELSVLRYVVSQSTKADNSEYYHQDPQTISVQQNRYPKEAFIEQDRISYLGLGDNQGSSLGRSIDAYIWGNIRENLPDHNVRKIQGGDISSLDTALNQYDVDFRSYLVILLCGRSGIRSNLLYAKKFTVAGRLGKEEKKGFFGEYDGIPVYAAINSALDGIMIFAKGDVIFEGQQEPLIEVNEFNDAERKELAKRENITEDKLKEEVFVKINVTCKLAVSQNCRTIMLLPS